MLSIVRSIASIKVAPDDSTKAALVDYLSDTTTRQRLTIDSGLYEYHSILSCAHELGVLIKEHDLEMLSFLSSLYDCPDSHEERRRSRKDEPLLRIPHPSLTFIAGTTPGYLSSIFPEAAWSQGFMARTICVYSADVVRPPLFGKRTLDKGTYNSLIHDLYQITQLQGEFKWTPEAELAISTWYNAGCIPVPTHGRLANYSTRRPIHALKLSMILSAARSDSMLISQEDVSMALELLTSAEDMMPETFLEMSTNSDSAIIQELHHYLLQRFLASKQKPIPNQIVMYYLSQRVPAWRANAILDLCESSGMIKKSPSIPNTWIPNLKHGSNFDG